MNNFLTLDLETGIKTYKKRKGSPWANKIVAYSARYNDFQYQHQETKFKSPSCTIYTNWAYQFLVGFNIKFDLLHLWNDQELHMYFKNGGQIFDCQLAEFYLQNFQKKYPALRETAVKYGAPEREKLMEAYWANDIKILNSHKELIARFKSNEEVQDFIETNEAHMGKFCGIVHEGPIDTKDIPEVIVLEDVENDVLDTEVVYLAQREKIIQLGTAKLMEVLNDCLLALTEIEHNGMRVNTFLLHKQYSELELRKIKKEATLNKIIKEYFPYEFNWASTKQLQLVLFGGEYKEERRELILDSDGHPKVFKTGPKTGELRYRNVVKMHIIKPLIYALKSWQTEKGNISLDDKVLSEIATISVHNELQEHVQKIAELVLELRGLNKQITAYYEPLIELVHEEDHCTHSIYNMVGTSTGRTSSDSPNAQQYPGTEKSELKYCFISRYV